MKHPSPLLFLCSASLAFCLPGFAQQNERPAASKPELRKNQDKENYSKLIGTPVSAVADKALWFPTYFISLSTPEQLARNAQKRAQASVIVADLGPTYETSKTASSIKHHWPEAIKGTPTLVAAWVFDGKIVKAEKMQGGSRKADHLGSFNAIFSLSEQELDGYPVVLLQQEDQFLNTATASVSAFKAVRACVSDDATALAALLDKRLSPNTEIEPGLTLVDIAAASEALRCLELLKNRKAELVTKDEVQSSALEMAAERGRIEAVLFLLANKVPTQGRSQQSRNALHRAAAGGHLAVVQTLLREGANPNEITNHNETPLAVSINNNYPDVAATLYEATNGQRMDTRDSSLVLLSLCRDAKTEMVRFFLSKGANARFCTDDQSTLANAALSGSGELAALLIKEGAPLDWTDESNATALFIACTKGNVPFARELLAAGADFNLCTKSGFSPLHAAVFKGNKELVQMLLAAGAKPNSSQNKTFSAFELSLKLSSQNCAPTFVQYGARLDPGSANFERNLEAVFLLDLAELLRPLLQNGLGADYRLRNTWNLRELAEYWNAKACIAVLDEAGIRSPDTPSCPIVKGSELQKDFKRIQGSPIADPRPVEMNFPATKATVRFLVESDGSVHFILVEDCSDSLLHLEIIDTVARWQFTPPLADGKPVAVRVAMPVNMPSSKERRAPVAKVDQMPVAIHQERPIYPSDARASGLMAQVTVAFTVGTDGVPTNVRVIKTSSEIFNGSAILCVKRWRFKPGLAQGKPVPVDMQLPILFSMNGR